MSKVRQYAQQCAAITLLIAGLALAWALIVGPIIGLVSGPQADIALLTARLDQLTSVDRSLPALSQREKLANQQLKALHVFWSGKNEGSIAASVQDVIRTAAQQSGGSVTSSSIADHLEPRLHAAIAVRARVEGSLDTLQHVLGTIDATVPRLFVDNLVVSSLVPATRDRPQQLSFEIRVLCFTEEPPS